MSEFMSRLNAMPEERRLYTLATLPTHLVQSNQTDRLREILWMLDFMQAKVDHFPINGLVDDLGLIDEEELQLLRSAIQLASATLSVDKKQLPNQIIARLISYYKDYETIARLMQSAKKYQLPSFVPVTPSFIQAGGPLIQTISQDTRQSKKDISLSRDGKHVITSGFALTHWDINTWDIINTIVVEPAFARGENIPNGYQLNEAHRHLEIPETDLVLLMTWDNTLHLWDIKNRREIRTLSVERDTTGIRGFAPGHPIVAFSDGQRIACAAKPQSIKIWDIHHDRETACLTGHSDIVFSVLLSGDERRLFSASADATVKVWDLQTFQLRHTLVGHSAWVRSLAVHPKSTLIASGARDSTVKIWNYVSGTQTHNFDLPSTYEASSLCFNLNGQYLIALCTDAIVRVWDIENGQLQGEFSNPGHSWGKVIPHPNGRDLLSVGADSRIRTWDLKRIHNDRTLRGHVGGIEKVIHSVKMNCVISASGDCSIKIWNSKPISAIHTLDSHSSWINDITVTPNGRYLISASHDETLKVWDIASGREIHSLEGHTKGVKCVAIAASGKYAVSSSGDKTLKVWDLGTGSLVKTYNNSSARHIFITENSQAIICVNRDDITVRAFQTGDVISLLPLQAPATRVVYMPLTKRFLIQSHDTHVNLNHIQLWDANLNSSPMTLLVQKNTDCLAVSKDENHLLLGQMEPEPYFLGGGTILTLIDIETTKALVKYVTDEQINTGVAVDERTYIVAGSSGRLHTLRLTAS